MKYNWRKRRFGNMFVLNFLTLSFKLLEVLALFNIYFSERVFKIRKQAMKDHFFIFSNGIFSLILRQVLELLNSFNLKSNTKYTSCFRS